MVANELANFTLRLCIFLIIAPCKLVLLTVLLEEKIRTPDQIFSKDVLGRPLDDRDFERAGRMTLGDFVLPPEGKIDPIEIAGLFEGDIVLTPTQELLRKFNDIGLRNAITNPNKKWPNGVIPYLISSTYNNKERAMIAVAIIKLQNQTCIKFVPRTTQDDYIHILRGYGCSSPVGRVGGAQTVSLGSGCFYPGIIMHELMHTTGFWHEHSRSDRNSYITIIWDNIQSGMEINFEKYDWNAITSLGVSYDLGSIMHYGPYAFAKDRSKPTIIPRRRVEIGQRRVFSEKDLKKINILYNCPGSVENEVVTDGECIDSNKYCNAWAALGECAKNPAWMLVNCKNSCKICGETNQVCEDSHIYCSHWEAKGECQSNPNYMLINCQKSCQSCV